MSHARFGRGRFATAIAVALPLSVGAWAAAALPASAATPPKCSVLNATLKGTGTVSKCTVPAATGGSGKLVVNIAKKTGVVTWKGTGKTTFSVVYSTVKTDEKEAKDCAKGTTELLFNGKVTGGSGAALKGMPKGQKITAEVCVSSKGVTLEPGTVITL